MENKTVIDNKDPLISGYIDALKGIAIVLMFWGHVVQYGNGGQIDFFDNTVFKTIYTFHMPLFMLISGYLFSFSSKKRDLKELINHKVSTLFYPILTGSALNMILVSVERAAVRGEQMQLVESISIYSLWFLWSVLLCSLALSFTVKLTKNRMMKLLILVIGSGFMLLFPDSDLYIFMYPFFIIGYFAARKAELLKKYFDKIGFISCIGYALLYPMYKKEHYIYITGIFGGSNLRHTIMIDCIRWSIGFLGSFAVCWIVYRIIEKFKSNNLLYNWLKDIGRDSISMYILSVSLLSGWLSDFSAEILGLVPYFSIQEHIIIYNILITPFITIVYLNAIQLVIKFLKSIGAYSIIFNR